MRTTGLIIGAVMMTLAGAAMAQTPPPLPPPIITNPSWASVPDAEVLGEAHPLFAAIAGFGGVANLKCVARADGGLSACEVLEAEPRGMGFDRAALSVVPGFRVNPRTVDGEDAKAQIQFKIHFLAEEDQPILPWTGPEPDADHLRNVRVVMAGMEEDAEAAFENALDRLGVDADREDKVRAILRQAHAEYRERSRDAFVLSMARLITPQELQQFTGGARVLPPEPPEEMLRRAGDQLLAFSNEEAARTRALYCAQFECPPLPQPPSSPAR